MGVSRFCQVASVKYQVVLILHCEHLTPTVASSFVSTLFVNSYSKSKLRLAQG